MTELQGENVLFPNSREANIRQFRNAVWEFLQSMQWVTNTQRSAIWKLKQKRGKKEQICWIKQRPGWFLNWTNGRNHWNHDLEKKKGEMWSISYERKGGVTDGVSRTVSALPFWRRWGATKQVIWLSQPDSSGEFRDTWAKKVSFWCFAGRVAFCLLLYVLSTRTEDLFSPHCCCVEWSGNWTWNLMKRQNNIPGHLKEPSN